jgi:cytochrome P450
MLNLFSEEMRRDPFPVYEQMRKTAPVFRAPPPFSMWMVFDYESVKRVISEHEVFSSRVPAPDNWFIFFDPPQHTKLRGLISRAFTPKSIANLEPHIRQLSRELLDGLTARAEIDLVADYAVPLPMKVIAGMIGIPSADWTRFKRWSDAILKLSYTMRGMEQDAETATAMTGFRQVTVEMNEYLTEMIAQRRAKPADDLLTRLVEADVDGERLTQHEILGFFQLLVVGGQETTTNLITNTMLCLFDNPEQFARLKKQPELLPSAIEETLRYRSPFQWLMRTPREPIELHGQTLKPGELMLAMIGSANRDPKQFADAERFDITRNPNPHIAFGHGIHSCLGAALSRMEAKIAVADLLEHFPGIERSNDHPWEPRKALHVHGPTRLHVGVKN